MYCPYSVRRSPSIRRLAIACCILGIGLETYAAKAGKNAPAKAAGAAVVFPARENLDPDQGTIEAWFCLSYSYGDAVLSADRSFEFIFPMVAIHDRQGRLYNVRTDENINFLAGISQAGGADIQGFWSNRFQKPDEFGGVPVISIQKTVPANTEKDVIKAGEWHGYAVTWQRKGDEYTLALYLDGKPIANTTLPINPKTKNERIGSSDLLFVGNPRRALGGLQSLRISKRARAAEEIAAADKAGLRKDADTLLYIDGDSIAQMKTDKLEDALGTKNMHVTNSGKVFGDIEFITGRNGGKAVRFQEP